MNEPAKRPPTVSELIGNDMVWLIAKLCHEVNRVYCVQVLSDHTHQSWEEAPEEQRHSAYNGVIRALNNPDVTPEEMHESWMAEKEKEGWTFGNRKDADAKTHPCLLPYHQLHANDRAKDHLFLTICRTMLGGAR